MEDEKLATTIEFKNAGELIYLLGVQNNFIAYSEYLHIIHGITHAPAPYFNLDEEDQLHKSLQALIRKNWVQSAHDVSEGGIFCCLAESCFSETQKGFNIEIPAEFRADLFLFGENQGRAILSIKPENKLEFELFLQQIGQTFYYLGEVTNDNLVINGQNWGSTEDYFELYTKTISNQF